MISLANNFEKVFLLVGNHDTYYKNTNQTNSLDFLGLISQSNNIHIINNETYFISLYNKSLGLFPWATELNYLYDENNNINELEDLDYAFGHFELNGIEQLGTISTSAKLEYKDIFKIADFIFSGHYHINKLYKDPISDLGKLQMVGSPMQLNWGDFNKEKYIYTLDVSTNEINKFKNNINARYEKVYYSKLESNEYTEDKLRKLCNKNYVKLVIDVKYDFNKILNFTDLLKHYAPISIEVDYLISLTNNLIAESSTDIAKSASKDNLTYLLEYTNQIYPEITKVNESIDLTYLTELITTYYKRSLLSKEEREEKELIK